MSVATPVVSLGSGASEGSRKIRPRSTIAGVGFPKIPASCVPSPLEGEGQGEGAGPRHDGGGREKSDVACARPQ